MFCTEFITYVGCAYAQPTFSFYKPTYHTMLTRTLLFILLIGLSFSSCQFIPPSSEITATQTIDTIGQEIRHYTQYTLPIDSANWSIDSVYNTDIQGTTSYDYQYTQVVYNKLVSNIIKWQWEEGTSPFGERGYPYQQQVTWRSERVTTPKGNGKQQADLLAYNVVLFTPRPLPYSTTAPIFQTIFKRINEKAPFPAKHTYPIAAPSQKDLALQIKLDATNPPSVEYDKELAASNVFEGNAVWLPTDSLYLPISVTITTPIGSAFPDNIVIRDAFPPQKD